MAVNTILAADVVIKDNSGKVLLLKRSPSERANPCKWTFPGGKIEAEESPMDAAIREAKEESGLDVLIAEKPDYTHICGACGEIDKSVIVYVFQAKTAQGEVALSEEHTDFGWFSAEELKLMEVVTVVKQALEQKWF